MPDAIGDTARVPAACQLSWRPKIDELAEEATHVEAVVRSLAKRAFDALQPYIDARFLPATIEDEDAFYEAAGVLPLFTTLQRIADHATAAALEVPQVDPDWFSRDELRAREAASWPR